MPVCVHGAQSVKTWQFFFAAAAQTHSTSVVRAQRFPHVVATSVFTRTQPVAWTDADPGTELPLCRKHADIGAGFRKQRSGRDLLHTGNALQKIERLPASPPCQSTGTLHHRSYRSAVPGMPDNAVTVTQSIAFQRLENLGHLRSRFPLGQTGNRCEIRFSRQQLFQNELTTHAEYVRQDARRLDVGFFQNLLHSIALAGPGTDHPTSSPGRIPRIPNGLRRNKAGANHTVPQKVGQKLAIVPVRLMATPRFHVFTVRQADPDATAFQHCINRLPVRTCALRDHSRAAGFDQPYPKFVQFQIEGSEQPQLHFGFLIGCSGHDTHIQLLLPDVYAGTSLYNCFSFPTPFS